MTWDGTVSGFMLIFIPSGVVSHFCSLNTKKCPLFLKYKVVMYGVRVVKASAR